MNIQKSSTLTIIPLRILTGPVLLQLLYTWRIPLTGRYSLDVYSEKATLAGNIQYTSSNNTLTITVPAGDIGKYEAGEVVRLAGTFTSSAYDSLLNGRELTVFEVDTNTNQIKITLAGQSFSDSDFTLSLNGGYSEAHILSAKSTHVEAFFEGADLQPNGSVESFNSKKIVLRETAAAKHAYKHGDVTLANGTATGIFGSFAAEGLGRDSNGAVVDSLEKLGFENASNQAAVTAATVWVDEKNPPITIDYDAVNQRFQFGVNHTAIGPGTDSNFRAFKISGNGTATSTNNLGIQDSASAKQETISSTAIIYGESL